MDDSILARNTADDIDDENNNVLGFTHNHELGSHSFLASFIKHSFLLGADKLLMSKKPRPLIVSEFETHSDRDDEASNSCKNGKFKGKYASKQSKKASGLRYKTYAIQTTSLHSSSIDNYCFKSCNDFPLNVVSFLTVLMLKLAGYQISLFLRIFMFPVSFFNVCLMFVLFPFQTMMRMRDQMTKKMLRACSASYTGVFSFVCSKFKSQESVIRIGRAVFCTVYVFFVLVVLLVSGFVIGGIVMRNLVERSVHTTETLNFDYTKTSPVAIVPITSSLVNGVPSKLYDQTSGSGNLGRRAIPYNHKLQLTVSLALPESDYNMKLGIFQVRVESLSANGQVILGTSYPTMLRFKSQPVRIVETLFNSVPLIAGLKSEVQDLKIVMGEFTEGHEPTAWFKVMLEPRAEFQAGVPEIYGASLEIESELPQLKRLVWNWRRTMFVWISLVSFVVETTFFLLFCRPVVLPGGRAKSVGSNKKSRPDKISWQKGV
ncbi:UNVERIFIED_CONTAM: Seipin-2 [Sesamum latifolium]|uniref:Seipin-2 n=1 Tax=Sesamum latifolium TaxID=2727402 RepID=A0AAW2TR36_9LAMI